MSDTPKRFEDWIEVECDECERWWTNQCDGVKHPSERSRMPCNSFLATRRVIIPEEIKRIKTQIRWLYGGVIVHLILFTLSVIFQGLGWL